MEKINVLESVISVKGKVFHNDGRKRIDLKKPIRDIFEPFEDSDSTVVYVMEMCLSKRKLMERTNELLEQEVMPILFYFAKKGDEE